MATKKAVEGSDYQVEESTGFKPADPPIRQAKEGVDYAVTRSTGFQPKRQETPPEMHPLRKRDKSP